MSKEVISKALKDVRANRALADSADRIIAAYLPDTFVKYLSEMLFPIRQYGLVKSYTAIKRIVSKLSDDEFKAAFADARSSGPQAKSSRNELLLLRSDLPDNAEDLLHSLSYYQIAEQLDAGLLTPIETDLAQYYKLTFKVLSRYAQVYDDKRAIETLKKLELIKGFASKALNNPEDNVSLPDSLDILNVFALSRLDLDGSPELSMSALWDFIGKTMLDGLKANHFDPQLNAYILSTPTLREHSVWHFSRKNPGDLNLPNGEARTHPLEHFLRQVDEAPLNHTKTFDPMKTYQDMVDLGLSAKVLGDNLKYSPIVIGKLMASGRFFSLFGRSFDNKDEACKLRKPVLRKLIDDGFVEMVPNKSYVRFEALNIARSEPIFKDILSHRLRGISKDPKNFASKKFWADLTRALTIANQFDGNEAFKILAKSLEKEGIIKLQGHFTVPRFYKALCESVISESHKAEKTISSNNLLLYAIDAQLHRFVDILLAHGHSPNRDVGLLRNEYGQFIHTKANKGTSEGSGAFSRFIAKENWSGAVVRGDAKTACKPLLTQYTEFCADCESPSFRAKKSDDLTPGYLKILDLLLPEKGTELTLEQSAALSASPHLHQLAADKGLSLRLIDDGKFIGRIGSMWSPENRGASAYKIAQNLVRMYYSQKKLGITLDTQLKNGETVFEAFQEAGGDELSALFNRERIGHPEKSDTPRGRTRMRL